ncbi:hypothetical protein NNC19_17285 [Clostridium sp. SHJSY1]|uniref:hypothetical protein n=1 Tax=Clostridium sp. SHJSY1 TaxID=2942483 RepID=UPI002875512D|nr:hypothetical protein [Clostridium sp. SHJSY1]MDS0527446.1 hypothetical protein [Clostridium sp. SHJSY1]
MNEDLFNKKEHLSEETLNKLKFGMLKDEEVILALGHIGECEKCAGVFADNFEDNELVDVPLGFQEKVQIKIKGERQSNLKFGFYCFKVVAAASIALMILFSNGLSFFASTGKSYIKSPNLSIVSSINENLSTFSEKITKLEVFNNDKEKK